MQCDLTRRRARRPLALLVGAALVGLVSVPAAAADPVPARADPDSDGDGLPDFQEVHKYRTDPRKKDTGGDGVPDGDWRQRREFTYSVRAVLRVMPPYDLRSMTDDYQDARLVKETKEFVELEVVAYPLNTNAEAIKGNPNWKKDYAGMKEYLAPGVTTNWDEAMRKDLLHELMKDGIDPDKLTDKEIVERVSKWLYARAKHRPMFCTHFAHFPGGKPAVFPGLEKAFEREKGDKAWTAEEQFAHELLGKEMFYRKTYGSCTSAAVYQATALRALGIPTRLILCVPLVDPSDPEQVELARKGLTHHGVRTTLAYALANLGESYTNHVFLEVFVGNRWRRLNYAALGQNVLDAKYLGLMVKDHTFNDLGEAGLAPTWGARYALGKRDDVFQHANPYRTLAITDHFGKYADVPNPPAKEHKWLTLSKLYWADAKEAREIVRRYPDDARPGSGRLFVHAEEWFEDAGDHLQYRAVLREKADPNFVLRAEGRPDVRCQASGGFITDTARQLREFEIVIPPHEFAKMAKEVAYTLHPVNEVAGFKWIVKDGVSVARLPSAEERVEELERRLERLEKRLEQLEKKGGAPPR
jgi:Transglutaminase-like superfamily